MINSLPHAIRPGFILMLRAWRPALFSLRLLASGQLITFALIGLTYLVFGSANSFAETGKFYWGTRITFSQTYDDNIDLAPDNEESDWITTVGPGLTLAVLFGETEINLDYDLRFSFYLKNDENNGARHSLTLSGLKDIPIAEHWTLDLGNDFIVSEDPLEISEQTTSTQRSRDRYYSNRANARLNHQFSEEGSFRFGFLHRLYITDDPDSEDSQEFRPGAGIQYRFSLRQGLSLGYEYARATFTEESDDFDKHVGTTIYSYRFSQRTSANLSYTYESTDFDGDSEDYSIHSGRLNFSQQITENTSWSLSGGYFYRDRERSSNDDGFDGSASLSSKFEKGSLTFELSAGGYREQYIEAENLGFSRYYRVSVAFGYQLMEKLTTTISGFYQRDEYIDITPERDDDLWQGRIALGYSLLPWLSSSLSYQYRRLDSTESEEEFIDNRITLTLVAFYFSNPKPF